MRTEPKQYSVFFVDDEPKIGGIVSDELKDLNCSVTCFASADDCLQQLPEQKCHLLITDIKMPGMDGLTLLKEVRNVAPWVPVMVITGYGDVPMAVKTMRSGAIDFIEKPLDRGLFLQKVKSFLKRSAFEDSRLAEPLTATEIKVLKMILQGMGNKQIAYKLDRSSRTVELHRNHIMHKFGVDNVVDLVKKAAFLELEKVEEDD
ncbi:MAG: response regulator transcription factor [Planctomycetota bacterium]|jgi:FixJ family two-component response regulator